MKHIVLLLLTVSLSVLTAKAQTVRDRNDSLAKPVIVDTLGIKANPAEFNLNTDLLLPAAVSLPKTLPVPADFQPDFDKLTLTPGLKQPQMTLSLGDLSPREPSINAILKKPPVQIIMFGLALVASRLNNRITGEDKVVKQNVNLMMQSTIHSSGAPETAKTAHGEMRATKYD
jgi:hypothetical protein